MNLRGIAVLRTKRREVNIEYSALVRSETGEGRFVRMGELRVERRALMALIAEDRVQDAGYHMDVCSRAGALWERPDGPWWQRGRSRYRVKPEA
jgi:hypothetical protein